MNAFFKDNKIGLYDVDKKYRDYLFSYDSKVNLKEGRKFIGIVISSNNYDYFIPLTSKPLRSNGKRRNKRTTIEIYDESNKLIAALLINNMIPVAKKAFKRINITRQIYKSYLNNEYIFLRKNRTKQEIIRKVNNVFEDVLIRKDPFMTNFCCDFKYLEKLCDEWNENQKATK